MSLATFTFPGKLGDALLQWPVAFQYAKQRAAKIAVWLDQGTLAPLAPLLTAQSCVERVELRFGITNYGCGGQPWDFGAQSTLVRTPLFHLGMRQQPAHQITLETLTHYPQFDLDPARLAEPSLFAPHQRANRAIVHLTLQAHLGGLPGVWSFLDSVCDDLNSMFEEIIIVGHASEVRIAHAQFPRWHPHYDRGNLLQVAELMAGARLVIGAGSSMVALAGALGIPWVRIHDPAGHPPHIFGSLGPAHLNEPLTEALVAWPNFRDALPVWEA